MTPSPWVNTPLVIEALPAKPLELLATWLAEAVAQGLPEPNAMTLATVDADGAPSARIVLLKGIADDTLTFFTNTLSRKGRALKHDGRCALVFHWPTLTRQVRVEGSAAPVADAEADAYFASRPRSSQLAAWASAQSEPLASRDVLEAAMQAATLRFAGLSVTRPAHWSGYAVRPLRVEFWRGREHRLHERVVYDLSADRLWRRRLLNP